MRHLLLLGCLALAGCAAVDAAEPERRTAVAYSPSDHPCMYGCVTLDASTGLTVEASSTLVEGARSYGAALAVDGDLKTAWCEGVEGDGVGQSLTLRWPKGHVVEAAEIWGGYFLDDRRLRSNGRIAAFSLDEAAAPRTFAVADVPAEYPFDNRTPWGGLFELRVTGAEQVVLTIDAVHAGTKHRDTCVSEIRLLAYDPLLSRIEEQVDIEGTRAPCPEGTARRGGRFPIGRERWQAPPEPSPEQAALARPMAAGDALYACARPDGTPHGAFVQAWQAEGMEMEGHFEDGRLQGKVLLRPTPRP
jgi:hypothetical protein